MESQTNGTAVPARYALATRTEFTPVVFTPASLGDLYTHATRLAASGLIPAALRAKPDDVAIVLMTGLEIGLSPMQSLRSIHVIEGKPSMSSELIVARVLAHPACEFVTCVESTDKKAVYRAKRKGAPEGQPLTWTIEMAARGNLLGKPNWKGNPEAMLRARAAAAICRRDFPDVMLGIVAEEERDEVDVTPPPAAEPPKARRARGETITVEPVVLTPAPVVETSAREVTPPPVVDAPAHDAATGETLPKLGATAQELADRIASAPTEGDLNNVAPALNAAKKEGKITKAEADALMAIGKSRRAALAGA